MEIVALGKMPDCVAMARTYPPTSDGSLMSVLKNFQLRGVESSSFEPVRASLRLVAAALLRTEESMPIRLMPTEAATHPEVAPRGSHVHFEYPAVPPHQPLATDLSEFAGCRKLAMAVVETAWKDLRGRNPDLKQRAKHYLTHTFWQPSHLWRMLIADLVVEEEWKQLLERTP